MAQPAPLRSKTCWLCALLLTVAGCRPNVAETRIVPSVFVAQDQSGWQQQKGRLWLNGALFSGWQYQLWASGDTAFVGAFSEGKAEGVHRQWYANGLKKEVRQYRGGWQEGPQRGWFESGKPAFVYHFQNDVYHGNRKEWLPNGQLIHDGNYRDGQEDGLQRQWYADGSLKANYVARNGRNYGFTGVKNCVNVRDSIRTAP